MIYYRIESCKEVFNSVADTEAKMIYYRIESFCVEKGGGGRSNSDDLL